MSQFKQFGNQLTIQGYLTSDELKVLQDYHQQLLRRYLDLGLIDELEKALPLFRGTVKLLTTLQAQEAEEEISRRVREGGDWNLELNEDDRAADAAAPGPDPLSGYPTEDDYRQ